jgi:hypothetical protein
LILILTTSYFRPLFYVVYSFYTFYSLLSFCFFYGWLFRAFEKYPLLNFSNILLLTVYLA